MKRNTAIVTAMLIMFAGASVAANAADATPSEPAAKTTTKVATAPAHKHHHMKAATAAKPAATEAKPAATDAK